MEQDHEYTRSEYGAIRKALKAYIKLVEAMDDPEPAKAERIANCNSALAKVEFHLWDPEL